MSEMIQEDRLILQMTAVNKQEALASLEVVERKIRMTDYEGGPVEEQVRAIITIKSGD